MFVAPLVRPDIFQARIVTRPDGLFEIARNRSAPGEWADCATIHDGFGEHWDCVAWLHDKPGEWWLSASQAGANRSSLAGGKPAIMGAHEVLWAADAGSDVFLVASPSRYVEHAWCGRWPGPSACVLDWSRPESVRLWLSLARAVCCETPMLARAVESVLRAAPRRQRLRITFETAESRKEAA